MCVFVFLKEGTCLRIFIKSKLFHIQVYYRATLFVSGSRAPVNVESVSLRRRDHFKITFLAPKNLHLNSHISSDYFV